MSARCHALRVFAPPLLVALSVGIAHGQDGGDGGGDGGGGDGDTAAGVSVSADGLLVAIATAPGKPGLGKAAVADFLDDLDGDLNVATDARKVSLTRLADFVAAGGEVDVVVRRLAGLNRVDRVVRSADGRDLILVGPAEPFAPDKDGRIFGALSGRPPLRLDDLTSLTAALLDDERKIGCSLDPRPEGLVALRRWLAGNSSPASTAVVMRRYRTMASVVGPHDATVRGVPHDSGSGARLLAADYVMKLISLGLRPSGVRGVPSHLALLRPGRDAIQRWWFVPRYDAIERSRSGGVLSLRGPRLELLAEAEKADAAGNRSPVATKPASVARFASAFSNHVDDLARVHASFADLQNLIDLTVVAAVLCDGPAPLRDPEVAARFADERVFPRGEVRVPRAAATL
ncbi:MAG: DUF1598 domain-containing protein, partial [Planctomycetota bacterium]